MIDLLHSPFQPAFQAFAASIRSECLICSPYITLAPVEALLKTLHANAHSRNAHIHVLTDISLRTLVQDSTDITALLYLFEHHRFVSVTYLPKIHAKVYIADRSSAIVASANFTDGGQNRNFEYGVRINDSGMVQRIYEDMETYRSLGAEVSPEQLMQLQEQVTALKSAIQEEQKTIHRKIRTESARLEREVEENLIRVRVKHKSINAIFSETILYLLARQPLPTRELHQLIRELHPDLCDDSIDRVIDGKHFGKLWKHQVRNAQVTLKKAGMIAYDRTTGRWHRSS